MTLPQSQAFVAGRTSACPKLATRKQASTTYQVFVELAESIDHAVLWLCMARTIGSPSPERSRPLQWTRSLFTGELTFYRCAVSSQPKLKPRACGNRADISAVPASTRFQLWLARNISDMGQLFLTDCWLHCIAIGGRQLKQGPRRTARHAWRAQSCRDSTKSTDHPSRPSKEAWAPLIGFHIGFKACSGG